MKKLMLAAAVLAALSSGSALAADIARPVYKAPLAPAPPPYSWTGFYLGANAGWVRERAAFDFLATGAWAGAPDFLPVFHTFGPRTLEADGFTGGVQFGYNVQFGGFLLGVEADYNSFRVSQTFDTGRLTAPQSQLNITSSFETNWLATVRGRAGIPFGTLLVYGTGGVAFTNLKASVVVVGDPVTNVAAGAVSDTRSGWTAGGGLEWAFARNWSAKAEYLYADFGSVSFVSAFNVDPSFNHVHTVHLTAQIVRAGINYKFDWGKAPVAVMAKY